MIMGLLFKKIQDNHPPPDRRAYSTQHFGAKPFWCVSLIGNHRSVCFLPNVRAVSKQRHCHARWDSGPSTSLFGKNLETRRLPYDVTRHNFACFHLRTYNSCYWQRSSKPGVLNLFRPRVRKTSQLSCLFAAHQSWWRERN